MTRFEYFLACMKAELFRRRAWIFTAFTIIQEGPDDWKKDPYPYRLVQAPKGGLFFVDPNNGLQLTAISDPREDGEAPFNNKERITLKKGDIANIRKPQIETNYGNLLANCITLVYPFGDKVEYIEGRFGPGKLEDIVIERLVDDIPDGARMMANPNHLYVSEYLKFADSMFYLGGFASIWVPAGTRKTLLPPPGIAELKAKLFEENKDRLHDPAVVAKIAKELREFDRAWLEGDDALNFMLEDKAFAVVRAKKFLMMGAETGLSEGIEVDLIKNSLIEGWDVNKFPAMNNSLRAGSFNRGAQTMLGGESVKWLLRASSNIQVTIDDCKSRLGIRLLLTEKNKKSSIGFSVVDDSEEGQTRLTNENIGSYLGKRIIRRSPMYCKLTMTDYCKVCVSERLAINPTAASSAVSEYGSAFLALYMKAAHGKALTLAKMNFKEQFQ